MIREGTRARLRSVLRLEPNRKRVNDEADLKASKQAREQKRNSTLDYLYNTVSRTAMNARRDNAKRIVPKDETCGLGAAASAASILRQSYKDSVT